MRTPSGSNPLVFPFSLEAMRVLVVVVYEIPPIFDITENSPLSPRLALS